jgi:hypothetical protein
LTHEDVQPITGKRAGSYRDLGDNNPNPSYAAPPAGNGYIPPSGQGSA